MANDGDFLLQAAAQSEQTPIEAGIGAAANARGYSISGAILRGYEVVAITPEVLAPDGSIEKERQVDVIFKTGPKNILKAEQEAKHAFAREEKKPEEKRRGIRIRYVISIDPTIIEERKDA